MKKRIVSLVICFAMILPALLMSGCKGSKSKSADDDGLIILTLYSITDEKTTDKAIQRVEKSLNRITEYEFGVTIKLKLYTAEEYDAEIQKEIKSAIDRNKKGAKDITADVVLINSFDLYKKLISKEYIIPLEDYILGNNKSIQKFVSNDLQDVVRNFGTTYAVANNRAIGDYEYFLLNKELVDKYYYDPQTVNTLEKLVDFIDDISPGEPGYTPIVDTYGIKPICVTLTDEMSLYGRYQNMSSFKTSQYAGPACLLDDEGYVKDLDRIHTLTEQGKLVRKDLDENTKALAVAVKGSAALADMYKEDYYPVVFKYPVLNNENVFNSVYAISSATKSAAKSMQVIEYLQTSAEFVNIFAYGASNTDYELDEDTDTVKILKDEYVMDPLYTGNEFLLYQNDRMDEEMLCLSADNWALGKEHNRNLAMSNYLGFSPYYPDLEQDDIASALEKDESNPMQESDYTIEEVMAGLTKLCKDYSEKIDLYPTAGAGMSYVAYLNSLNEQFKADKYYQISNPSSASKDNTDDQTGDPTADLGADTSGDQSGDQTADQPVKSTAIMYFESPFQIYRAWYTVYCAESENTQ